MAPGAAAGDPSVNRVLLYNLSTSGCSTTSRPCAGVRASFGANPGEPHSGWPEIGLEAQGLTVQAHDGDAFDGKLVMLNDELALSRTDVHRQRLVGVPNSQKIASQVRTSRF